MDLVYFVRRGENPELRFSLRSAAAHLPHERVWIVGDKPNWVTGVEFIQGNRRGTKWLNVFDNLRIAAADVDADRFIVMNDDFFITEPVDAEIPAWHRGPLADHIRRTRSDWNASLVATLKFLRANGFPAPLSYEIHAPVVMEREKLGVVLDAASGKGIPPQWRTIYGNWWHIPAERAPDVKVRRDRPFEPATFFSTSDMTFASTAVGRWIRQHFPTPSPYERH